MPSKLQAGIIKPAKFADGTGPGVVGDAPQLQTIDPNAGQVQYTAPEQMSLDDAHKQLQALYGPGQDYSDALAQIQALQGQIKPQGWGDHLIDMGSRLMGGGNFGEAVQGAMQDDRNIGQQNLTNIMALMKARQAIQASQQERADQIAGHSESYADAQNRERNAAAKTQYDVNRANADAGINVTKDNNGIAISQQQADQRRLEAMSKEPEVAAMLNDEQNKAAAATDPNEKAAHLAKAQQLQSALTQIQALKKADLDMKNKGAMDLQNNANANAIKLQQMRDAETDKRDKMMYGSGSGDPQQDKISQLSKPAQQLIMESEPIKNQIENALRYFEQNHLTGNNTDAYFLPDRVKYAAGMHTDASDLLGNLELGKVIGAARVLKGSSRALPAMQQAQEHLPNMWKDSPALMYSKLANVYTNLLDGQDAAYRYGSKSGATPPLQSASGKTVSIKQLMDYSQKKGTSITDAIQEARKGNYRITE